MSLFKKKNKAEEPMDLDSVMKKYDQESNVRIWEGTPRIVVNVILATFALFCLYVTQLAGGVAADHFCGLDHFHRVPGVPGQKDPPKTQSYPLV